MDRSIRHESEEEVSVQSEAQVKGINLMSTNSGW